MSANRADKSRNIGLSKSQGTSHGCIRRGSRAGILA